MDNTSKAQSTPDGHIDPRLNPPVESAHLRPFQSEMLEVLELKPLLLPPNHIAEEYGAINSGTYGDVIKATYTHPHRGKIYVTVKHFRVIFGKEVITKLFANEIYVWSKFNHPNVLPLIGFFFDQYGYPAFVSEWMENGSSWSYVKKKPNCDLICLFTGVAEGLVYLHGRGVIHSDIKPENIVVNSKGEARIWDFSRSCMIAATKQITQPIKGLKDTQIYSAYELVVPDKINVYTKKTDVWAFGMTIYALLTHQHPYATDLQVHTSLSNPEPKLPPYPSPDSSWTTRRLEAKETIWNVCQLCWKIDPDSRADMSLILSILKTPSYVKLESEMEVDQKYASGFRMHTGSVTSDSSQKSLMDDSKSKTEAPEDHSPLYSIRPDILAALKQRHFSPDVITNESKAVGCGMYGDVTSANIGRLKVAIKHFRIYKKKEIISLFEKEIYVWAKLDHPNVLPLIGFYFDLYGYPSFVSEWMEHGSSLSYVKENPNCNLIHLITGVAEGLAYLHEKGVIHSDIRPDNIVVNSKGDARICDFGGSRLIDASQSLVRSSDGLKGTKIYSAYELVVPDEISGHTKKTDVWAFGMTIYALLTQRQPYDADLQVYKFLSNPEPKLPPYPSHDSSWSTQRLEAKEIIWSACQFCWKIDPDSRADMAMILSILKTHSHDKLDSKADVDQKDEKENPIDVDPQQGQASSAHNLEHRNTSPLCIPNPPSPILYMAPSSSKRKRNDKDGGLDEVPALRRSSRLLKQSPAKNNDELKTICLGVCSIPKALASRRSSRSSKGHIPVSGE